MHIEKIIPVILMLFLSFACCFAGWYAADSLYSAGEAGAVIGFVLPTFVMYWLSKVRLPEEKDKKDNKKLQN